MSDDITPMMKRLLKASVEFGWDTNGYGTTGLLYGIELAFRHPEWAQAVVAEARRWTDENDGDLSQAENTLDLFVALVPIEPVTA